MDDDASEWVETAPTPVPASGAWREGMDAGERHFASIGDLPLEADPLGVLPDVTLAFETWGTLNEARDNAIYVAHALTGDSHVFGHAGPGHVTGGWWNSLVGPGRPLDTDRFFVVSANVVGGCQGSTGPASPHPADGRPWGSRFPWLTLRDMVEAERRLMDLLAIPSWRLIIGPSMGGMRAIEWAATYPDRVRAIGAVGTTAVTTAEQIAWAAPQMAAIENDPAFRGGDYYDAPDGEGPHRGLGVARMIAHTTYRSEPELDERFGNSAQEGENPLLPTGRYAVRSYLEHHGDKLARRFDANTYLRIVHSINTHDVGRGRGGAVQALSRYSGEALIVAVDSDRLYPVVNAQRLAEALPQAGGVHLINSPVGHDGILVESGALNAAVAAFLERTEESVRV